jgi:4-carboxymuconolactone decarboxylase
VSRLPKISDQDLTDEQRRVMGDITSGPRGEVRGPFIPLLHNPKAADAVQRMGSFLRFDGTLPGALRELAILVVARHWTAQYEWFAHHRIALEEGLDPNICDAIANGQRPEFNNPSLEVVYELVTELHQEHQISAATFKAALDAIGEAGVVELIVLCGHYNTISMVLNGFEVEVPGGAKPLG